MVGVALLALPAMVWCLVASFGSALNELVDAGLYLGPRCIRWRSGTISRLRSTLGATRPTVQLRVPAIGIFLALPTSFILLASRAPSNDRFKSICLLHWCLWDCRPSSPALTAPLRCSSESVPQHCVTQASALMLLAINLLGMVLTAASAC